MYNLLVKNITVPLQIFFLFKLLRLLSKTKIKNKKNVHCSSWLGTVLKITWSDGEVFNQTR